MGLQIGKITKLDIVVYGGGTILFFWYHGLFTIVHILLSLPLIFALYGLRILSIKLIGRMRRVLELAIERGLADGYGEILPLFSALQGGRSLNLTYSFVGALMNWMFSTPKWVDLDSQVLAEFNLFRRRVWVMWGSLLFVFICGVLTIELNDSISSRIIQVLQ